MKTMNGETKVNRHQYLNYWIEVFIEPLSTEKDKFGYAVSIELPNKRGVVTGRLYGSYEEAVLAAEELIASWN